ncbi:hypothetical protein ACFSYD_24040 [Paracoccus aerius]
MADLNALPVRPSRLARARGSDLWWSFSRSPSARIALVVLLVLVVSAFLAPLIAPQNPMTRRSWTCGNPNCRRSGWRVANGRICWARTPRGATCCRSCSTGRAPQS